MEKGRVGQRGRPGKGTPVDLACRKIPSLTVSVLFGS